VSGIASKVIAALKSFIVLALDFLVNLFGLGGLKSKVERVIDRVRAPIIRGIDWVLGTLKPIVMRVKRAVEKGREKVAGAGQRAGTAPTTEDTSGDLRREVQQALAERLKGEHSEQEAAQVVHAVAGQFKAVGLKSLELGPETEHGTLPILAEASPKTPLASLIRGVPRPRGRSVTSKIQLELALPIEVPATVLQAVDPIKAGVPTGGAVWTPSTRASKRVNVVTWNTSDVDPPGNNSHAEHQFVSYMESRKELWPLVERITVVNVRRSPCSVCAPELAVLLKQIRAARKGQPVNAQIYWTQLHSTGAQPTTWEALHEMQSAKWGLNAPGTALPPEKGYHADMVIIKLI
jgi:hypothetical protein